MTSQNYSVETRTKQKLFIQLKKFINNSIRSLRRAMLWLKATPYP